jgi:hypothetical protein
MGWMPWSLGVGPDSCIKEASMTPVEIGRRDVDGFLEGCQPSVILNVVQSLRRKYDLVRFLQSDGLEIDGVGRSFCPLRMLLI